MGVGERIVRIRPVEKELASDPVRRIYDTLEQRSGRSPAPLFGMDGRVGAHAGMGNAVACT